MRYLVTGGAGFIGSHLVEALVELGEQVVVLDDFSTGKRANLAGLADRVDIIEGSVTDAAACARAVAGCDFVLHQAAVPSVQRSIAEPHTTHEVNVTGTLNILCAARDAAAKRVVFAGSSSVYGNTPEVHKREGLPTMPESPYAASKAAAEEYCRAFFTSYGLETVVLRYFNIFGPRQDPASQYAAVVPLFITAAIQGMAPTIYGDGEQTRDFTHVQNAVSANLLACRAPRRVAGRVFNVGCGERYSVNHLWARIRLLTETTVEPSYSPRRTGDVQHSLASLDNSRQELGYAPLVSLEQGLEQTIPTYTPTAAPR